MTLTYNGVALAELGELVIMPPAVRYEPADAPQRAVHTLTVRLHSWQQGSWEDNYETLRTIARAVATQHALLEWVDGNGVEQVSRPVRVVSHSFPEEGATVEHTSHQSIEIVFEWLDHLSATTANALTATYQRTGSAAALSLGQVERFGGIVSSVAGERLPQPPVERHRHGERQRPAQDPHHRIDQRPAGGVAVRARAVAGGD